MPTARPSSSPENRRRSTVNNPLFLQPYPPFSPDDCEALRQLVSRILKPGCRILEVGSWLGTGSTRAIIEMLLPVPDALLYCVDTWQGSPNVGRHLQIVQNYDVLATFRHNVELSGGRDRVKQLVMTSQEAAKTVADNSFDLVFIDGDHSYLQTSKDIERWHPKVRNGGILCGHDCECRPAGELRNRIILAKEDDCIDGQGTVFAAIHPGVVVAVEEAFEGAAHLWGEHSLLRDDGSKGYSTIWDIVK